ncbi:hypothetical protein EVAR_40245_1 [Eumeta japonica]|uniref:Uncharacterized protein n=1 Tax=Eumeta variegata TaxID=151549 RepID=A0A4C1Y5S8_EUMVA|nr:hypothetical protein EVAR_40245_1 [Eumeta japonica]
MRQVISGVRLNLCIVLRGRRLRLPSAAATGHQRKRTPHYELRNSKLSQLQCYKVNKLDDGYFYVCQYKNKEEIKTDLFRRLPLRVFANIRHETMAGGAYRPAIRPNKDLVKIPLDFY